MNLLALDIGTKFTGVCLYLEGICIPYKRIGTDDLDKALIKIIEENQIEKIIIGIPLNMKGEETIMSKHIREFSQELSSLKGMEIIFINELLTSKDAEKTLKSRQGIQDVKEKIDPVAACLIMENYLDEQNKEN